MTTIDRTLGRLPMYRVVSLSLGLLVLAAVVLSLTGQLAYPITAVLASWAVAVVVTVGSSWAFARIAGTSAHLESAAITGVILWALFLPSTAVLDLVTLGAAALVASASKYVLAWRGKHLFNPAAIGAFVIALTGTNAAGWWIATPPLLPVVLVGAVAIVLRTRRFALTLTFLAVATVAIVVTLVGFGQTVDAALVTAFTQYPILFFAGFMLTEPLTLPPRRWQQVLEGAVVALLVGTTFSIGPVYSSPELALLVGNLLAFALGQRRGVAMEYLGSRALTPTSTEFSFLPSHPVRFAAGQYMEITLPHGGADRRGIRRVFSIVSAPGDEVIRFGVRTRDGGSSFKRALLDLAPGATVRGTVVAGDFTPPRDAAAPVAYIAGGIGITPFASHLGTRSERDAVLVYQARSADELAYLDEVQRGGATGVVVTPDAPAALGAGFTHAAGALDEAALRAALPDAAARRVYVSGSPEFVHGVRRMLRRMRVRGVRTDSFSGY